MKALLWKDYRMNRVLLLVAFLFLVTPYIVGIGIRLNDPVPTGFWPETMASSAIASMASSLLVISLLAANAFAGERADRSAEFLVYLPPSKASILTSKLLIAGLTFVFLWGVNLIVVWIVDIQAEQRGLHLAEQCRFLLITSVLVFAAGWAASTVMSSPIGAWGIASAAPVAIGGAFMTSSYFFDVPTQNQLVRWYSTSALVLAAVAFVASSLGYLRRVGP